MVKRFTPRMPPPRYRTEPTPRTNKMTLIKSESGSRGNGQDFNKQFEFYCLAKLI